MKVALCGLGRAGKEVIRALIDHDDIRITSAFCRNGSEKAGKDIGEIAMLPVQNIVSVDIANINEEFSKNKPDVLIDFSNTAAIQFILPACCEFGVPVVICTTGFTNEETERMKEEYGGGNFGIVYAPNVTVGVNVMMSMLKAAINSLPYYDYNITEIHHNKKADKPSGTAKKIAALLEKGLHMEIGEHVPINSVRAGGYIGVHEVMAVGDYERITIVHESFSRRAFAEGAILAARYIIGKTGWHVMEDVINEKKEHTTLNYNLKTVRH